MKSSQSNFKLQLPDSYSPCSYLIATVKENTFKEMFLEWNDAAEPTRFGPLCLCFNVFSGFKPIKFAVDIFNDCNSIILKGYQIFL